MLLLFPTGAAQALTDPFQETFTPNNANWTDNSFVPLNHNAAGGQDGLGYVDTTFNFELFTDPNAQGPVLFRAGPGASGGDFFGDWLTPGVNEITAWVRHDAIGTPINFFARVAGPANFPGAISIQFVPTIGVPGPAGWTQLVFDLSPGAPGLVFEGTPYAAVFSNVGRLQIGASIPAALAGVNQDVLFELDSVSIRSVPEPQSFALLAASLLALTGIRRSVLG